MLGELRLEKRLCFVVAKVNCDSRGFQSYTSDFRNPAMSYICYICILLVYCSTSSVIWLLRKVIMASHYWQICVVVSIRGQTLGKPTVFCGVRNIDPFRKHWQNAESITYLEYNEQQNPIY